MSVCLNISLCIDLILMVRYPFNKKESRVPIYLTVSSIVSILSGTLIVCYPINYAAIIVGNIMCLVLILIYLVLFAASLVYTCRKLTGPGISKESRNLILKRHISTTLVYCISNAYMFATCVLNIMPKYHDTFSMNQVVDAWWADTLKILFVIQGLTIPLLRLNEPYFYSIVQSKILHWWKSSAKIE